ncbi:MAG: hypothetical protein K2L70_01585 [Clostridia bacterium]|nr:hypothetical protein [Clostridia bacterium]
MTKESGASFHAQECFLYDENECRRTCCTSSEFEDVEEALLPCKITPPPLEPN